ncbi:hypothetical protein F5148DRAFT_1151383 [Russula earlei]|uniref:Uncharacterized protein n=2 Tax=Russula earlei TaxID=71964 RepID=A0ACC0U0Z6_9AGAM|nr:hypothetical protein F5148DRAFT_1154953 [Russula earlei]KAI9456108.1 hypothetical protein F5148DRAFT_1151383 [Russula earlei]
MAFEYGQHNVEQDVKSIEKQDVPHVEKCLQQHTYSTQCADTRGGGELRPVGHVGKVEERTGREGMEGIWQVTVCFRLDMDSIMLQLMVHGVMLEICRSIKT